MIQQTTQYIEDNYEACVKWAGRCLSPDHQQEAEDIVISTLIGMMESKSTIKDDTAHTFVMKAIHNRAIDFLRTNKRRAQFDADYAALIRKQMFHNGDNSDPAKVVDAEARITERLTSLSPLLRNTLLRVLVDGASPEDVADEDLVSADVVYKRIERAKRAIQGE